MSLIVVDLAIRKKEETVLGDVGKHDLAVGEKVIVEIDQTQEIAEVKSKERVIEKPKMEIYKILRKLTEEDSKRLEENRQRNISTEKIASQKIEDQELNMKLTAVAYSFDRTKLFIYYTADTRIDFRQLIKDLGHALKTRIQMVQIGVRDEAKMFSGLGPCGRELCCRAFLRDFCPVAIDMVKLQDPSMNITKLSGVCGRLMCCLAYEDSFYQEQSKKLPRVGAKVHTPEGQGKVVSVHYLKEEITVEFQDKRLHKFPASCVSSSLLDKIKEKAKILK